VKVLSRLDPAMTWRMSLAGEISYKRTFAPFGRSIRAKPKMGTKPV